MRGLQHRRLLSHLTAIPRGGGVRTSGNGVACKAHALSSGPASALRISIDNNMNASNSNVLSKNNSDTRRGSSGDVSCSSGTAGPPESSPTTSTRRGPPCYAEDCTRRRGKSDVSCNGSGREGTSLNSFAGSVRALWSSSDVDCTYQSKGRNLFRGRSVASLWTLSNPGGGIATGKREGPHKLGGFLGVSDHNKKHNWDSSECIARSWRYNHTAAHCGTSSARSHVSRCCSSIALDETVSRLVLGKKTSVGVGVQKGSSQMSAKDVEEEEDALVPLGKLCAMRNLCSRREAEFFAAVGLVRVNGKPVTTARDSDTAEILKVTATNICDGDPGCSSSGSMRKFPVFFVKRNADVQLMPRAQRVMDSRLTVLLHKPLHYLSCQAERTAGNSSGKPVCRQLLTAERRWQADSNDIDSDFFSSGCRSSRAGNSRTPRLLNPGACKKMGCAGRLDSDSSGLIVFTQDGRIASLLVGGRPTAVVKEYLVEVDLPISASALELLRSGSLTLDGRALLPATVRLLPPYSTSLAYGLSDSHSKSRFSDVMPAFLPDGTPPAVVQLPRGALEAVAQLQDKEEAFCAETRGDDAEVIAREDTGEERHGESNSCIVNSSSGAEKEQANKLQGHPEHVKDATSRSCFLLGAERNASRTPPPTLHRDGASVIRLPTEDHQGQQAGRASGAVWAGKTTRMAIELFEGRHRQIRRMCELVGLRVLRLHRIRIGRIPLGALPVGRWRLLLPHESFV